MKFLYCCKKTAFSDNSEKQPHSDVTVFTPKLPILLLPGEKRSLKAALTRFLFQTMSKGKARVYCMHDGGHLMHTSYVVPACRKFPFLGKSDYEIGPCYTYPDYRGRGIYPAMLRLICESVGDSDTVFYMIVDEANAASIRGIEKAGFVKCGVVEVSRYTKCYRLVREDSSDKL